MFFPRPRERIEPWFDPPPTVESRPMNEYLEFRFEVEAGRTFVWFDRDGDVDLYFKCTHPLSAYQMVVSGIRRLAESDPERPVLVVDGTGGYEHWLAYSPVSGARRAIQDLPRHYIDDGEPE